MRKTSKNMKKKIGYISIEVQFGKSKKAFVIRGDIGKNLDWETFEGVIDILQRSFEPFFKDKNIKKYPFSFLLERDAKKYWEDEKFIKISSPSYPIPVDKFIEGEIGMYKGARIVII